MYSIRKLHVRLSIALELAKSNPVYEDIASKFFEVCLPLPDGHCM